MYLLLLSTRELIVMQSEHALQPKQIVDIGNMSDAYAVDDYAEDGYDFAFVVETGQVGRGLP